MDISGKVAIIGASGKFPGAETPMKLDRIFSERLDSVMNIPKKRINLAGCDPNGKYAPAAYLDDIDCFDYQFFGISKKEAIEMDPQHRLALESVCKTIESAGYSTDSFRGTNTSVIIGAEYDQYDKLFNCESLSFSTGMMLSYLSGRISYLLDLHGEAMTLSTACSSSLYAVYDAYIKLISMQCDMAISGGINLQCALFDLDDENNPLATMGIMSKEGHCKTFDDSADGITICEGMGFILMKRLEDAIKENDNILAVISGMGANQDGGQSSNLTAPSAIAQSKLYEKVWRKAGISPENIGYYEAHGTGTRIGDPIEIDAINMAFEKFTDKKHICPIGSLKTNFGHPLYASGIASIMKAILSINLKKKYPLRSLEKPNSLISFSNSPVYPITELEEWNDERRIIAINSLGFSGTNVHMLIENYPDNRPKSNENNEFIVKLSTKSQENLSEYKKNIADSIMESQSLADISYVLCCGRNDCKYRDSAVVRNLDELRSFLKSDTINNASIPPKLVILCSGSKEYSENEINKLRSEYNVFSKIYESLSQKSSSTISRNVIVDVAIFKQLEHFGIKADYLLSTGMGNASVALLNEQNTDDIEVLCQKMVDVCFEKNKFLTYMKSLRDSESKNIICIDISNSGLLLNALSEDNNLSNIFMMKAFNEGSLLQCLSTLYNRGININFDELFKYKHCRKIMLATYPFLKTPAWPSTIKKSTAEETISTNISPDNLKEYIRKLWMDALGLDNLDDDTDLFDIGLNSLIAVSALRKLNNYIDDELEFDDLYDYNTISELYEYIKSKKIQTINTTMSNDVIKLIERTSKMTVSGNQKRMLFILENAPNKALYNMPVCYKVNGKLDIDILKSSFVEIIKNNEILHTVYVKENGNYYQRVLSNYNFDICYINDGPKNEDELQIMISKEVEKEFDLLNELPLRITLIKYAKDSYYLILNAQHIACDGWTLGLLIKDLNILYNGKLRNKDFSLTFSQLQYADYSAHEENYLHSNKAESICDYWKKNLAGIKGILEFPIDKMRPPIQTNHGDSIFFELEINILKKVEKFCRFHKITKSELLESVYAILLYKYSADSDICIGMPVANRNSEAEETMYGFFANSIAVRSRFEQNMTIINFILKNAEQINNGIRNSSIPFDEIAKLIDFERRPSHSALYQFFFTYQNFNYSNIILGESSVIPYELDSSVVRFDLNFVMKETPNSILINAEYDKALFSKKYMNEIVENYKLILNSVIDNENAEIDSIGLKGNSNILIANNIFDSLF